jgi:O-antigen ligase
MSFAWGALLIAVLWAGLYFSYSQSSLLALFAVVVAIAFVAGDRLARRAVLALALVAAVLAAGLAAASARNVSTQKATSDRSRRVELTARVFAHHPLVGVGIGAQPFASQKISPRPGPLPKFVSHTTPLTVAAELGILGVAAYLAVIAGAARVVDAAGRTWPSLGLALGAVLLALIVHSLFYSGFFEDPMTWLAMGIAANVALRRPEPA